MIEGIRTARASEHYSATARTGPPRPADLVLDALISDLRGTIPARRNRIGRHRHRWPDVPIEGGRGAQRRRRAGAGRAHREAGATATYPFGLAGLPPSRASPRLPCAGEVGACADAEIDTIGYLTTPVADLALGRERPSGGQGDSDRAARHPRGLRRGAIPLDARCRPPRPARAVTLTHRDAPPSRPAGLDPAEPGGTPRRGPTPSRPSTHGWRTHPALARDRVTCGRPRRAPVGDRRARQTVTLADLGLFPSTCSTCWTPTAADRPPGTRRVVERP